MAKLACGLLFGGVLGFPLLAAIGMRADYAAAFGVLAVLLAFMLGLLTWRERLGKFVVLASGSLALFVTCIFASWNSLSMNAARQAAESERALREAQADPEGENEPRIQPEKPQPDQDMPVSSANTPAEVTKSIIKGARERNSRIFQNGLSKSFKAELSNEGPNSDPFGDFGRCVFISANTLDKTHAEVVVEANDGSGRRFTFRMILEDGGWKLNELGSKAPKND
jgi:hypothetical protein